MLDLFIVNTAIRDPKMIYRNIANSPQFNVLEPINIFLKDSNDSIIRGTFSKTDTLDKMDTFCFHSIYSLLNTINYVLV